MVQQIRSELEADAPKDATRAAWKAVRDRQRANFGLTRDRLSGLAAGKVRRGA